MRYQQALGGIDGLLFLTRDRLRPFVSLGVGAENDRRNLPNHQNSRTSPYAAAGVGVQYAISDQFAAEIEYKKVFGFQRSDVYGFRRNENNYATVGLTYYFDKTPTPARLAPKRRRCRRRRRQAAPPPPPPPPAPRFEKQTLSATRCSTSTARRIRQPAPKLDEIANALKANPRRRERADHRLHGPARLAGLQPEAVAASRRRGQGLSRQQGMDASRLTTAGKGEADPVVQCSEKNRAALIKCLEPNRRVEVEDVTIERRVQ